MTAAKKSLPYFTRNLMPGTSGRRSAFSKRVTTPTESESLLSAFQFQSRASVALIKRNRLSKNYWV